MLHAEKGYYKKINKPEFYWNGILKPDYLPNARIEHKINQSNVLNVDQGYFKNVKKDELFRSSSQKWYQLNT